MKWLGKERLRFLRGQSGLSLIDTVVGIAILGAIGVAVLSGPGLAWLLVRGLAVAGPMADVGQVGWGVALPQASWVAALVGALACAVSLLTPLPSTLRRSIVTYPANH